jgi:hypothetical protein
MFLILYFLNYKAYINIILHKIIDLLIFNKLREYFLLALLICTRMWGKIYCREKGENFVCL